MLDPETLQAADGPGQGRAAAEVKPPDEVLPGVLADLEKDTRRPGPDGPGTPRAGPGRWARSSPASTSSSAPRTFDPAEDAERLNDGKTLLVTVGQKGKYVGVVGLFQDPKQKLRYQRVTLDNQVQRPGQADARR